MKKKKRKKLKLRKSSIVILILVVVFIFYLLLGPIKLKVKGYSLSSSFKINNYGLRSEVLDNNYSILLDKILETDYFDKKYLKEYFDITYYERKNFEKNISVLLKNGYSTKMINTINKTNDDLLLKIALDKYNDNLVKYIEYPFFKPELFDRYEAYFNGDYEDTLIKVNIGLDKEYYKDPKIIDNFSITMLINKYNKLTEDFVPPYLVELDNCSDGGEYLSKEAKLAFDKLCEASIKDGMKIGTTSAYRNYESQVGTYNYYLKNNGSDYTKKYVASPGFSEHQTGLAIDVKSLNSSPFKSTKEYKWMKENAYKYGFILRYPEGKESITGFNSEAWHFRYVGVKIATYIKENDVTYDEYCAIFM